MGVSGWVFLLVATYPVSPGTKAVKRLLLFLLRYFDLWLTWLVQLIDLKNSSLKWSVTCRNMCSSVGWWRSRLDRGSRHKSSWVRRSWPAFSVVQWGVTAWAATVISVTWHCCADWLLIAVVPRPTQPSIPPESVNEDQLWLVRQRHVGPWFTH